MSDPADDGVEMKLDQALLEFMRRFDAGKVEDRDSFLAEFPDLAPQLRTLLDLQTQSHCLYLLLRKGMANRIVERKFPSMTRLCPRKRTKQISV